MDLLRGLVSVEKFDAIAITETCLDFPTFQLSNSNASRDFWHLANNISNNFTSVSFPPLLQPDGPTAVSSFSKAELFA